MEKINFEKDDQIRADNECDCTRAYDDDNDVDDRTT